MRTQVAIIGGGPSGLLLSQLLNLDGIATVVLERRSRAYVLSRIRAGLLEWGTVETLRRAAAGTRMDAEGLPHDGIRLATADRQFRIDFAATCGRRVMIYGQAELTRDLYAAQDALGATIVEEAADVALHGLDTARPFVTYAKDGSEHRIDCEFVAGCDGFHGVSRPSVPAEARHEFERVYPFGWLGVLSHTPPVADELIYSGNPRGFALATMRSHAISRYYIQVPATDSVAAWSDGAFWDELRRRLPPDVAEALVTGPAIDKSIAGLRSFVCEPMSWGRLFLCGDAAHIVPPTGAKGLNLAVSDVHYLHAALRRHYRDGDDGGLADYSATALARVWKATRFSWWMTTMLHRFPDQTDFDRRIRETELAYVAQSEAARTVLAENYTGLPF